MAINILIAVSGTLTFVLLLVGIVSGRSSEGLAAAALLGGLTTGLVATLSSLEQHRERLDHERSVFTATRIAEVRRVDVERVQRWIRGQTYASVQAAQYGLVADVMRERKPEVTDRLTEYALRISERQARLSVKEGTLDGLLATVTSEELASAMRSLEVEARSHISLANEMSEFARARWTEDSPGAAAEAARLAELFQQSREGVDAASRAANRLLEQYAAGA